MTALQKKVSVVLCTYNGEKFLQQQLDSILQQTYAIDEIIIVDDCSTDDTKNILSRNALNNNIIKMYINDVNIGFTKNFQKALLLATNNYIAIADQDDVWKNDKIEKIMSAWDDKTLLAYCNSIQFRNDIPTTISVNKKNRKIAGDNPRLLSMFNTVSGHNIIIKKELLSLATPFPNTVFYDWWLALVAMCNGGIFYVDEVLVYQRAHQNNVTIQQLSERKLLENYKSMLNNHLQYFYKIPNMKEADKFFFKKLKELWQLNFSKKWNWKLFLFLMKHRHDIYFYKVRKVGFFSHLKNSIKYSTNIL